MCLGAGTFQTSLDPDAMVVKKLSSVVLLRVGLQTGKKKKKQRNKNPITGRGGVGAEVQLRALSPWRGMCPPPAQPGLPGAAPWGAGQECL